MKSINQFISESLNTFSDNNIKKIFKKYNIKVSVFGATIPNLNLIERHASYKEELYFLIRINTKDNLFSIVQEFIPDDKIQTYDFIDGKWKVNNNKNQIHLDDAKPQTNFDDISMAFSDENFEILLGYMEEFKEKNYPKQDIDKLKKEQEKRFEKITPQIISILKQYENDKGISYDELMESVLSYGFNKNKINKILSPYKSNTFIELTGDEDLSDLIIYDGWDPEIDPAIIDDVVLDKEYGEACITIFKYEDYTVAAIVMDINHPDMYLIK